MHPGLSERILRNVPAFAHLAEMAGNHHERLYGSGYARGRTGDELDLPSRILAVADVAALPFCSPSFGVTVTVTSSLVLPWLASERSNVSVSDELFDVVWRTTLLTRHT